MTLVVAAVLFPSAAGAQVTWQPAAPPLVTAENETWYRAGNAIEWNGELYYPAGAPEAFNRYQMVRSGSYRGIPLYTDTTLEPYSIVFVPIAGGRMQPYERPRTGMLAGSVGSRTSSFPTSTATEQSGALGVTAEGFVVQAAAPPTFARAYDLGPGAEPEPISPAVPVVAGAIGRTPSATPATRAEITSARATATSGRVTTVTNGASTAARPTGINNVWLTYNGRRWVSAGPAVGRDATFTRVGDYRGFPVYQRVGDSLTIYVPTTDDLIVPFKPRGL
jgi:hypothetical protein